MGGRRKRSKKRSGANSNSTPPEVFNFFLDECVAGKAIAVVFVNAGHVVHHQAQTFGTGTLDVDWLPEVGQRGWVLITKDKNIRKRPLELLALTSSGVRAFVLTSGGLKGEDQRRVFGDALPRMLRILRRQPAPFIARVTADSDVEIIDINKYTGSSHTP
jgi:hypothetical protein